MFETKFIMSFVVLWLFKLTVSLCLDEIERLANEVHTLCLGLTDADQPNAATLEWVTQQENSSLLSFQIITDILYSAHVEKGFVLDHGQALVVDIWDLDEVSILVGHLLLVFACLGFHFFGFLLRVNHRKHRVHFVLHFDSDLVFRGVLIQLTVEQEVLEGGDASCICQVYVEVNGPLQ